MLDTTFFIDIRRGGDEGADRLWNEIASGSRTDSFSAITAYELWIGSSFSREEEPLYESMFALLEPVSLDVEAAKQAANWLRSMTERSELLFRNALIAASARPRNETVITRNQRDFVLFPGVIVESY